MELPAAIARKERAPFITPYVPSMPPALQSDRSFIEGRGMLLKIPGSDESGDMDSFRHSVSIRFRIALSRCRPLNVRLDLRVLMACRMFMAAVCGFKRKRLCGILMSRTTALFMFSDRLGERVIVLHQDLR